MPDDAGGEKTFAELGEAEKNRISHRARALARLREWLATRA
ncbi:MAG: non-canonical purine NTP pyrophosphatase [Limisphaerales bacterium]